MSRRKDRYSYTKQARRHVNPLLRLCDTVLFVITLLSAGALVCAYVSRYVNPNDVWFFAFMGMAAPILYLLNLLLALYWIVRWKPFAFLPIAVLVAGAGWVSLFFKPTLSKHQPDERSKTTVVMSYNVAGFLSDPQLGPTVSTLDSTAAFIRQTDPDILCIQEFQSNSTAHKPRIDSLIGLPYNRINVKVPNSNGGGWGLAIYSRYRIVESGSIDFEHTTNSALWADIALKNDTLRVFNCHLQTTSVKQADLEYIMRQEYLGDDADNGGRVKSIAARLRNNFRIRANQADSLAAIIGSSPYKVVVCGDFNDTPMSYAYRTIRGDLADSFAERGSGIPNTYKGLFNLFRIDYILHSPTIETASYDTPENQYSDHKPVVAGLDI